MRTVRVAESGAGLEVEKGLLSPEVVRVAGPPRQAHAIVRLPPRYRKLEAAVARAFGALPMREAALVRGLVGGRRWLKAQLGRTLRRGSTVKHPAGAAP
jgi:hypothetical protein